MNGFTAKLEELILTGTQIIDRDKYSEWADRVHHFLAAAIGDDSASKFFSLAENGTYRSLLWESGRARQIGYLEGLVISSSSNQPVASEESVEGIRVYGHSSGNVDQVFIVHGHDNETKETVARFLENIEVSPIILHEQANSGMTIIEKIEKYSNVKFAVVLLTPDDIGSTKGNQNNLKGRARQNVILELGYFTGKLGRERVCPLYKKGVEVPSDFHGVVYTEYDETGGWRIKLAQELVEAGIAVNLEKLINK